MQDFATTHNILFVGFDSLITSGLLSAFSRSWPPIMVNRRKPIVFKHLIYIMHKNVTSSYIIYPNITRFLGNKRCTHHKTRTSCYVVCQATKDRFPTKHFWWRKPSCHHWHWITFQVAPGKMYWFPTRSYLWFIFQWSDRHQVITTGYIPSIPTIILGLSTK